MAKDRPHGKVIDFRSARKASTSAVAKKMAANAPAPRGGFLDAWLKNHEDSQSLIQENLSLQNQQRRLEAERHAFLPSLEEHLLYYGSLACAIGVLVGLIMLAG